MKWLSSVPRLKSALRIAFFWLILGGLQALYEYTVVINYDTNPERFNFWVLLQSNLITLFTAGLLAGFFVLPRLRSWLREHSYAKASLYTVLGISALYFTTSFGGSFLYNSLDRDKGVFDPEVIAGVYNYLTGSENLKNYFFWLLVGLGTVVATEIGDKYGPGNFTKFLRGRYFHPKEEQRIFMFLDIRGATSIAEALGELRYFQFVKDFFRDVTFDILAAEGEIYQYVGDEVIVSWPLSATPSQNNRCVAAFFAIQRYLQSRTSHYQERYGLVPSFKVGLHCGEVIIGEIGIVKRDIAFSGDVLNTAARIQAQCNAYGVDILISAELLQQLEMKETALTARSIGNVALRGKAKPLTLYTLSQQ